MTTVNKWDAEFDKWLMAKEATSTKEYEDLARNAKGGVGGAGKEIKKMVRNSGLKGAAAGAMATALAAGGIYAGYRLKKSAIDSGDGRERQA